mgnify:CR=1 FL=1
MNIQPITLEGQWVRLEPLSQDHCDGLWQAAQDESIWRWMLAPVNSRDEMRTYIDSALAGQAAGIMLPFATIDKASGRIVGSTRFDDIVQAHRRVEIGWTWIAPPWQRSAINTEAKYLMLQHAFERWNCVRVQLKTDSLNERSRAAILRIGAKEEGTLRNHYLLSTGRLRHSIYFSILDTEWPTVKASLQKKLSSPAL